MKVCNIMEEYVTSRVELLYNQLNQNKPSWLTCSCDNCRMDTICYVLNRVSPRYIVSGRGILHSSEILNDTQLRADIDAIALEGIRLISTVQRPYHNSLLKKASEAAKEEPSFNFPMFIGTVYDGTTFAPLADASIKLTMDNAIADMIDSSWSNPCSTFKSTKGSYSFWTKPIPANAKDESRHFRFTVQAVSKGYSPASYAFDIPVVSESTTRTEMNSSYSLKIQDLFLFREDAK